MEDRKEIFKLLKSLLRKHAKGLLTREDIPDSKAKEKKEGYGLYGERQVSIGGRKPQWIYVAGIIMQKHFVGFYHMPMYSHPKDFIIKSPLLQKARKGKSCLNITKLDKEAVDELDSMIRKGISIYRKEGWL